MRALVNRIVVVVVVVAAVDNATRYLVDVVSIALGRL